MWFSKQENDLKQDNRTEKRKLGDIGENAVAEYLKSKGFNVLDRNYSRKWGELDLVVERAGKIYFIEVKSISREINRDSDLNVSNNMEKRTENISREKTDQYRAEDNMHPWKLKRLGRAIQTYLLEKKVSENIIWQFDVATVLIDTDKKLCKVEILEDLVL